MKKKYVRKKVSREGSSKKSNDPYIEKLRNKIGYYQVLKNNLRKDVDLCNLRYKLGIIDKNQYRLWMDAYLKERSLEEWEEYYDTCRKILKERIKEYETKGVRLEKIYVPKISEKEFSQDYFDKTSTPVKSLKRSMSIIFPFDIFISFLREKSRTLQDKTELIRSKIKVFKVKNFMIWIYSY